MQKQIIAITPYILLLLILLYFPWVCGKWQAYVATINKAAANILKIRATMSNLFAFLIKSTQPPYDTALLPLRHAKIQKVQLRAKRKHETANRIIPALGLLLSA